MAESSTQFQLAAIDLDGTLLGPDHGISEANALAVRRLQAAGVQVVLASGRHFHSMRKYVDALPGMHWVVSSQGGEVSNASRTTVLSRQFLSAAALRTALTAGQARGLSMVAYAVDDVLTDSEANAAMEFYTEMVGCRPGVLSRSELLQQDIFKVIWLGEATELSQAVVEGVAFPTVQVVRTHAHFLEFMPADMSKASALATLAGRLGIPAAAAVAFGDGENDIPMFAWAGVSVAMAHGWPRAQAQATFVAPEGPANTALARGVDWVLRTMGERCEAL